MISEETYKLSIRQNYPLWMKIHFTKLRIKQWYDHWEGQVYVSVSGGKDSGVLLDIVRSMYPEVTGVHADTGQEYPEIREFLKTIHNIVKMKPRMNYKQIIEKYGWPIISKKVAMGFDRYKNTKSELQKQLRLHGGTNPTSGKKQLRTIPIKFHYLIDANLKISDRCCDILKKEPFKRYEKETGKKPFIGTMIGESEERKIQYLKHGCNAFDKKAPQSNPLSFWTTKDIWQYIKEQKMPYSKIYDMGEKRTGCMGCGFGIHLEERPNRFDRMKKVHPKHYDFYMNKLGMKKILDVLPLKKQYNLEV